MFSHPQSNPPPSCCLRTDVKYPLLPPRLSGIVPQSLHKLSASPYNSLLVCPSSAHNLDLRMSYGYSGSAWSNFELEWFDYNHSIDRGVGGSGDFVYFYDRRKGLLRRQASSFAGPRLVQQNCNTSFQLIFFLIEYLSSLMRPSYQSSQPRPLYSHDILPGWSSDSSHPGISRGVYSSQSLYLSSKSGRVTMQGNEDFEVMGNVSHAR